MSYREKQNVLCQYETIIRQGNSTRTVHDSLMVKVEFSDQIPEAFYQEVKHLLPRNAIDVRLKSYLPESGGRNF